MSFRVIVIDETTDEHDLMLNEEVDEETVDVIVEMVETGEFETFEGCADVCNEVSEMLSDAGVKTEDHEEMVKALECMKLVKKVVEGKEEGNGGNGKKKVKKVVKKNGK